jgi:hypothetical protein
MTTALAARFVLGSIAALFLAGCGKFEDYEYHYKIEVIVRDHGELKRASGVVKVRERIESAKRLYMEPRVCGEATVVPLKANRYLFVMMNGLPYEPAADRWAWRDTPTVMLLNRLNEMQSGLDSQKTGLPDLTRPTGTVSNTDKNPPFGDANDHDAAQPTDPKVSHVDWGERKVGIMSLMRPTAPVEISDYELPEFVTFSNVKDPTTARRVDPKDPWPTLGDVQIVRVTIRATDEKISRGNIRHILRWLTSDDAMIDGSFSGHSRQNYRMLQFERCADEN